MTDDRGAAVLAERLHVYEGLVPDRSFNLAGLILGEHGVFLVGGHSGCDMDLAYEVGKEDGEAEVERLREALVVIAEDDDLVKASGGAWGQQAYERRRDIARAALSPEPKS